MKDDTMSSETKDKVNGGDYLKNLLIENTILKAEFEAIKLKIKILEEENHELRKLNIRIVETEIVNRKDLKDELFDRVTKIKQENKLVKDKAVVTLKDLNETFTNLNNEISPSISKLEPESQSSKRSRIDIIDKEKLIDAYENDKNWIELSNSLGIKYNTAHSIIRKWVKEGQISAGKMGGYRKRKISDIMGSSLIEFIQSHNMATLREMQAFLLLNYDIKVSLSAISSYLDGKLLSVKLVGDVPEERNSDLTKEKRFNYVKFLLDNSIPSNQCIYIGKSNYNVYLKKPRQQSIPDANITDQSIQKRRRLSLSLCMAIKDDDIVHYQIREDLMSNIAVQDFVSELSLLMGEKRAYFIVDDGIGSQTCDVQVENSGHEVVYLPPYSSFLNPVEALFAVLRQNISGALSEQIRNPYLSLADQRMRILEVIEHQINVMILSDYEQQYRQCMSYYVKCIKREDIIVDH